MIIKDDGFEYKLNKLNLNDGDLLIIKYNSKTPSEQLERFIDRLESRIKQLNKNIIPVMIMNDMEIETLSDESLMAIIKKRKTRGQINVFEYLGAKLGRLYDLIIKSIQQRW